MTADGFQADPHTLTTAAAAAADIARNTQPILNQLNTAIEHIVRGAPDSESASVAGSQAKEWTASLSRQITRIEDIGKRIEKTAADYLDMDRAIGQTFDKIGQSYGKATPSDMPNGQASPSDTSDASATHDSGRIAQALAG